MKVWLLAVLFLALGLWLWPQMVADIRASESLEGFATWVHPSLANGPVACHPKGDYLYDPQDPYYAAAVGWPCFTVLELKRDERVWYIVIRDRGHLEPWIHIDLSEAAFSRIGSLEEGKVKVSITEIWRP